MPLHNQSGQAFVAFTDISGFKSLMKDDRALKALNNFYTNGFLCLQNCLDVQGLFISDCGVLFTRNHVVSIMDQFIKLLEVIHKLNKSMLEHDIMLTTSIAYGDFSYHNRIEFDGIQKSPIYGNAYLSAFLDNENGLPKIQPGMCRIIKNNLPSEIIDYLQNNNMNIEEEKNHYIFYWMCDRMSIEIFKTNYKDSYNRKYRGMLSSLKKAAII
jgi:hypothetical protein